MAPSTSTSVVQDEETLKPPSRAYQASIPTADYERFLSDKWLTDVIPTQVSVHSNDPSLDHIQSTLPFLSSISSKVLPTYFDKASEDVSKFLYKLKIFLHHPSIDNAYKQPRTTHLNTNRSKNLATLLGLCISGDELSPFTDNDIFEDKGVELVHHRISMKHPTSQASASAIYNTMYSMIIRKHKTFDAFVKRIRTHYRTCTRSSFPYREGHLVRCFINGLDSNFDNSRTLLQNGALHWFTLILNEVIQEVMEIKLNCQSSGAWTTDDGAANMAGKQGTKRPDNSSIYK